MTDKAPNSNFSSNEETKNFVTPFAFEVHESLLGMRLGSPGRRLAALSVDLLCIALLTKLPGLWLSFMILLVFVWTLYKLRGRNNKPLVRLALVGMSLLTLVVIGFQLFFNFLISDDQSRVDLSNLGVELQINAEQEAPLTYRNSKLGRDYSLVIGSLLDAKGEVICADGQDCDTRFFDALAQDVIDKDYKQEAAATIYVGVRDLLEENDRLDSSSKGSTLESSLYQIVVDKQGSSDFKSVLAWLEGTLSDLGVSFGWAAVYFSVLTAWWNGQTIGKRLFGLKVVRIDGEVIDLWESIGRYGGYSAGLATGFLGFLQIYWDANRQGIQDKISETLVVRP